MDSKKGACLCGAVRFVMRGELRPILYCHCDQCRITSGHFVAATACKTNALEMIQGEGLRWYRSSDVAQRGFCGVCGSSLFWRPDTGDHISVMAGTIENPTGLAASEHIFTEFAADYYAIDDGLPRHPGRGPVTLAPPGE